MNRWVGKGAVVTGASAGIGENVAEKLVEEGLQVVGLARRVEKVEELSKKLSGKPGKLRALKCDVSSEDDVKQAFHWVLENLGPVSILINNAGLLHNSSLIDGEPQAWKQVLDVNLFGTAVCTQQAVKQMKAAGIDGHVININSIAGHQVFNSPDNSAPANMYAPSKFGITAYTEVMRQELRNSGSKIKITSISPGVVETKFLVAGDMTDVYEAQLINQLPQLLPEDITDGIIYALSTKPHVQIHEMTIKPVGELF